VSLIFLLSSYPGRRQPVDEQQSGDPFEFGKIVGDNCQAAAPGVGGNMQIIDADRAALEFQFRTDAAVVIGRLGRIG